MTYQRALEPEDPSRGDPEMAALIDLMSGTSAVTFLPSIIRSFS
jgi:hypothetical protein